MSYIFNGDERNPICGHYAAPVLCIRCPAEGEYHGDEPMEGAGVCPVCGLRSVIQMPVVVPIYN